MYKKITRHIGSEFDLQLAYLEILEQEESYGLTPKQLRTLAAICYFSKSHRAITNTVKHKAREFNEDSQSSFSNSLKSLYSNKHNIIQDDLIEDYFYVPKDFQGFGIIFDKVYEKKPPKEPVVEIQVTDNLNEEVNEDTKTTDS